MTVNIVITGEPSEFTGRLPGKTQSGVPIRWRVVPVLRFRKIRVSDSVFRRATGEGFDWLVFSSPRAVLYWSQLMLQKRFEAPTQTQVATVGRRTAQVAHTYGWTVRYYPQQAGSEPFLRGFLPDLKPRQTIVIPRALHGRTLIERALSERGHRVLPLAIYDTCASVAGLKSEPKIDWVVFTSPSSYRALREQYVQWRPRPKIAVLGDYTAACLSGDGVDGFCVVPQGNIERIGELL